MSVQTLDPQAPSQGTAQGALAPFAHAASNHIRPLATVPDVPDLSVRLHRFGADDALELCWAGICVRGLEIDGVARMGPAVPGGLGRPSIWLIPRLETAKTLTVKGQDARGQATTEWLSIDPTHCLDGKGLARLTLAETPVDGGLRLVPRLDVLVTPDGHDETVSPFACLTGLRFGRRRPGRPVLSRPVVALMPWVTGAIADFSRALALAEEEDSLQNQDDVPFWERLLDKIVDPGLGNFYAEEPMLADLYLALEAERELAGAQFRQLRRAYPGVSDEAAVLQWSTAMPQLVAVRLCQCPDTLMGLLPPMHSTDLAPMVLGEGDTFEVTHLPATMRLEVALQSAGAQELGLHSPCVTEGALIWPQIALEAARSRSAALCANALHPPKGAAQVAPDDAPDRAPRAPQGVTEARLSEWLRASGVTQATSREDRRVLAAAPTAPDWIANVTRLGPKAFRDATDTYCLQDAGFWASPDLPVQIVKQVLGYLVSVRIYSHQRDSQQVEPRLFQAARDGKVRASLAQVDAELAKDPAYARAVFDAAAEHQVEISPEGEGRLVALLFAVGALGASGEAFLDELGAGRVSHAVTAAAQALSLDLRQRGLRDAGASWPATEPGLWHGGAGGRGGPADRCGPPGARPC